MIRFVLSVAFMAALVSPAPAAILQFIPGTVPVGENPLTVIGDGTFEIADTANPTPNDFQFPAVVPFDVQVIADDEMGGTVPVIFTLDRLSTTADKVNLVFSHPNEENLLLWFDVPGISQGDAIPAPITDADGLIRWNAPSFMPPSTAPMLAGALRGGQLIPVPEPNGLLSLFVGLLVTRSIRQR